MATGDGGRINGSVVDVSAVGIGIVINENQITDFMDDVAPVRIDNYRPVQGVEWSLNGRIFRSLGPTELMVTVCVIPGSRSDTYLRSLMFKQSMLSVNGAWTEPVTGTIFLSGGSNDSTIDLFDGTLVEGCPYSSVRPDGRREGNSYTFAFGSWR